jgi:hypothetical protein
MAIPSEPVYSASEFAAQIPAAFLTGAGEEHVGESRLVAEFNDNRLSTAGPGVMLRRLGSSGTAARFLP